jgi:phage regulator Rha-like protein
MQLLPQNSTITSLELVEQINLFRKEDLSKNDLAHSDLLKIIRDEFEEEIGQGKISQSLYFNSQNKEQPMFELTTSQAKQVLVRESKLVRKAVIAFLEKLESQQKAIVPQTYKEALLAIIAVEEEKEQLLLQVDNLSTALDSLVEWVSIIKICAKNKIKETVFDWRYLKKKSAEMGYSIKKAQSARYGFQNLYHINVFKACYPQFNYEMLN